MNAMNTLVITLTALKICSKIKGEPALLPVAKRFVGVSIARPKQPSPLSGIVLGDVPV